MSAQPEALRIATWLEETVPGVVVSPMETRAAAELRRLHALNDELLGALKAAVRTQAYKRGNGPDWWEHANFCIAKATKLTVQRLPSDDTEGGAT